MRTVTLVLGETDLDFVSGDLIGVDGGALYCALHSRIMKIACGDFDSVEEEDIDFIALWSDTVMRLDPIKDETDFTYALGLCQDYDEILVLGGLGGRRDHEYLIVRSAIRDKRIHVMDKQNDIRTYEEGIYTLFKKHQYISFFPIGDTVISLTGFRYPLEMYSSLGQDDCLTSNEILEDSATLVIHKGKVMLIQSSDA